MTTKTTRKQFIQYGREGGLKGSRILFRSLADGFISNAGAVAQHNRKIGACMTLKERVAEPSNG